MKNLIIIGLVLISLVFTSSAFSEVPASGVYFANLKEGAKIKSPVKIEMGVSGKTVHPAGELIDGTGHHHIVIDGNFVPEGMIVPADDNHIHYGKGQTETELNLKPGKHTLTLQFANGGHKSYGEAWSKTIEVIVE